MFLPPLNMEDTVGGEGACQLTLPPLFSISAIGIAWMINTRQSLILAIQLVCIIGRGRRNYTSVRDGWDGS